jgi:hypothetical protein
MSALLGGEWSASCPWCFTPGERSPGTHLTGGCVNPRATLENMEKRKFLTQPVLKFFLGVGWDQIHLACQPLFSLLYQPWLIDDGECGAVGEISGRGNWSIQRKPVPMLLSPPQIPHDLTWVRTWATTVGNQWLTAWIPGLKFLPLVRPTCSQLPVWLRYRSSLSKLSREGKD